MPLTDTAIRRAKPEAKQRKLFDERGLFLLISCYVRHLHRRSGLNNPTVRQNLGWPTPL